MAEPTVQKGRNSHPRWIDIGPPFPFGDQASAFDLRLPLGAFDAMPFATALAGLRIAHVDDDGPMTGGPFANVPLHRSSPTLL